MNTTKILTANRSLTVFTSEKRHTSSALKFEHNQMSVYVPLRTAELKQVRDAIDQHLKQLP